MGCYAMPGSWRIARIHCRGAFLGGEKKETRIEVRLVAALLTSGTAELRSNCSRQSLSLCLLITMFITMFAYRYVCLSLCLLISLLISTFAYLSVCLSLHKSCSSVDRELSSIPFIST